MTPDTKCGGVLPSEHYELTWRGIAIRIAFEPVAFGTACDSYRISHIAIETSSRQPLPITETGYRSDFPHPESVATAGGPVAFVTAWLERASRSRD